MTKTVAERDYTRKEHGNSKRDSEKRKEFIELIKRDVTFIAASSYVKIPERTVRDWIERDEELSQEYDRARNYMDVITSNVITNVIMDKDTQLTDRAKYALEWKKRRDERYKDKKEINGNLDIMVIDEEVMVDEEIDLEE